MKLPTSDRANPWRISMFPLLALLAGALVLGGCGSSKSTTTAESTPATTAQSTAATTSTESSSTAAPATASSLNLEANPEGQLKYNTSSLNAKAGKVTIDFKNMSPLAHNVTVESGGATVGATETFQGSTKKLTLTLKPGTYKFFCTVPGHRQAGMEGTLIVK